MDSRSCEVDCNEARGFDNKKIIFLVVLALLIFGVRLLNINEAIYDDEANFAFSLSNMDVFGFNQDYYSPQPLNLIYKPFVALFGLSTWIFRLVPLLFGIINTIFLYFFARRNWGFKVAFWATFLMLISLYPTLASLQFDAEGNIVMFSVMLMFFSYLEFEKLKGKYEFRRKALGYQILGGIGLGVAIISKYNSVCIVLVLAIYSLYKSKFDLKESFNDLFMIYLVGFLLFLSYVILGIIASPSNWLNFIWVIGFDRYHGSRFGLMGIGMYLLWSTPLLFGFYVLGLFDWVKKNSLLMIWISVTILFYTFILSTAGSMDRYFMQTIPALAILGGIYISRMKFNQKELMLGGVGVAIFTILMFLINLIDFKYVSRFAISYLSELKNLNLNFLFSYTSASGPTFGVNFLTIFLTFGICFASLLLFLVFRKKYLKKSFMMIFLVVAIAFNIFLVSEYIFHPTGVDVSSSKNEMIEYVKAGSFSEPMFSTDTGVLWHFDPLYRFHRKNMVGVADNEVGTDISHVYDILDERDGGTLMIVNWPPLPLDSPVLEFRDRCVLDKKFFDGDYEVSSVYRC